MVLTAFPESPRPVRTGRKKSRSPNASLSQQQQLPAIEEKDVDISRIENISFPDSESNTLTSAGYTIDSSSTPSDTEPVKEYLPPFGQPISRELILDPQGLPLSPQPLPDEQDPLTWSNRRKLSVLIQISLMSFLAQFLAMSISSALWPLHTYFGVTFGQASYIVNSYIVTVGVGPFLWNPMAHRFGRRPLLITSMLGLVATAVGSGLARTYPAMLTLRSLTGVFAAIPIGLGSVVVCDLFYEHQRGFYMGIYMVFMVTGGHLGPMVGGYIYKGINWHWCFYVPAMFAAVLLITVYLTVPETLYLRTIESIRRPRMSLYQHELVRKQRFDSKRLTMEHFFRPFKMLQYPSIVLPSLYYSVVSGYANMVFIISSAMLFHYFYQFRTWQTGLLLGVPLTLGSWLGEFGAGGFSDWVGERRALRRGGKRIAEDRLWAMLPGVLLAPLGLAVVGLSFKHRTHWIGAGLGIAISSAGFQVISSITYAYTAECYPRQTSETATLLNFGRQMFSFTLPFYTFHFIARFGVQTTFLVYAVVEVACFLPMLVLMFKGASWRERYGGPNWNLEL